jgi:argininosuccinate lyase
MERTGLNYRTAHRIVGLAIRLALDTGEKEGTISAVLLDKAARQVLGHSLDLPDEALSPLASPSDIVATRKGVGGAAVEPIRAMLRECAELLGAAKDWKTTTSQHLDSSEVNLLELAAVLAAAA